MHVTGSCHCGAVAYEADVDPNSVTVCHCTDCQRLSGSVFRASIASVAGTFVIRHGTPKIYMKIAESGARRRHGFCAECGAPIYATSAAPNPQIYSLRVGGIDQRAAFGLPVLQIWCRSALPWSMDISAVERG